MASSPSSWDPCSSLADPRVNRWDLAWTEQMDPEDRLPGPSRRLGLILVWLGAGGGYGSGWSWDWD